MKINVGIDLGTTYSAVACFNKEKGVPEILKNGLDNNCTPSVVYIKDGKVTIGEEAKNMQAGGEINTAAFYKSMMGEENYCQFIDGKKYTPEDLSYEFLKKLKEDIETANGVTVDGAVITVPAYFEEKHRDATINAGKRAGLRVLKIINEPTSAIIAYGLTGGKKRTVMVYDLGGGTFDVTIAEISGTKVNVIATTGNPHLGGKNWDSVLEDEIINRFEAEFNINLRDCPEALPELKVTTEELKKKLTNLSSATAFISYGGYTGRYEITRDFFEKNSEIYLNQTLFLIKKCFEDIGGGFGWQSIDEVVLVGGSTRMPQVKETITREYGRPPMSKNVDVDTIVAAGAAIEAQLCVDNVLVLGGKAGGASAADKSAHLILRSSDIQDITAHGLGMLAFAKGGDDIINSIIIPKNSKMDRKFGREYSFSGKTLEVYVLQGDLPDPYYDTLLYKYIISGMPGNGQNKFTVNFLYNRNGMVEVEAKLDDGRSLRAEQVKINESLEEIIEKLKREREEAKKVVRKAKIMFIFDSSYSMEGAPMNKAKESLKNFIREFDLSKVQMSIIEFATTSRWLCEFTSSEKMLIEAASQLDVNGPCGCSTEEVPLYKYGNQFGITGRNDMKIIVVLTDGQWTNQKTERIAAHSLKSEGVVIYAVGFGAADEEFLEDIASENGARKIDLSMLNDTFMDIASSIATEL